MSSNADRDTQLARVKSLAKKSGLTLKDEDEVISRLVAAIGFSAANIFLWNTVDDADLADKIARLAQQTPDLFEMKAKSREYLNIHPGINENLAPEVRNELGKLDISTLPPARRIQVYNWARDKAAQRDSPPLSAVAQLEAEFATRDRRPVDAGDKLALAHAAKRDEAASAVVAPPVAAVAIKVPHGKFLDPMAKLTAAILHKEALKAAAQYSRIAAALPSLEPRLQWEAQTHMEKAAAIAAKGGVTVPAV